MSIPFNTNAIVRPVYISDTHHMSTLGKKEVRINLKINPRLREEFQAAAHLRGASMSSLLHQHIVKIVREEKERSIDEFNRALEFVRAAGPDEEGNQVYFEGTVAGSTKLTASALVTHADGTVDDERPVRQTEPKKLKKLAGKLAMTDGTKRRKKASNE